MQGLFQTFKYKKFSCHLDKKQEKGTNASDLSTPLHDMKTNPFGSGLRPPLRMTAEKYGQHVTA